MKHLTDKMVTKLTFSSYSIMLAYALSVTMLGTLMPSIIEHYGLSLGKGGLLVTSQSIGGIIAIAGGGILSDFIRKEIIIASGFGVYLLALLAAGMAPGYTVLMVIFFFIGITKMVDTVLNAYISDLHPHKRGKYINLLHTFFGAGAFLGPLFASSLLNRGFKWNLVFTYLALLSIVVWVVYSILTAKNPISSNTSKESAGNITILLKSGKMWLFCAAMFFYVGHQSGVSIWIPMYMQTYRNVSTFFSGVVLSIFWIGIILGRYAVSFVSNRVHPIRIILFGSLAGGILLTTGYMIENSVIFLILTGLTGLLTGAVIPLLVVAACNMFPVNSGTASSMIFLSGTAANMIFPFLTGVAAEKFNFGSAMYSTSVSLLLIALAVYFILRKDEMNEKIKNS